MSDSILPTAAPAGWPTRTAWPPFKDGATYAIGARRVADPATGTQFYAVNSPADNMTAQVTAYGADGGELRSLRVTRTRDSLIDFAITQAGAAIVTGAFSYTRSGDDFEIRATLKRQTVTLRGNAKDPGSVSRIGQIQLGAAEVTLAQEFGLLSGELLGLTPAPVGGAGTVAKYSCGTCRTILLALTAAGVCCIFANAGCCISALLAAAIYDENCPGACPPPLGGSGGGASS